MGPRVLIAESDAELVAFLQRFLTRRGYAVETAAGGLECLEKLHRFRPQVLVLNVQLLWGGGDGVLARLREGGDVPPVPVVLTGADGNGPDAPPVVRRLLKPFSLADLLDSVHSAAPGGRTGPPAEGQARAPPGPRT
jgi:CheY-like chemotaxis protein